jgi:anti-sigma regulatory factor (Ser/Thr protein kinase)
VLSTIVPLDEDSRIPESRRLAITAAREEHLTEEQVAAAGIVATEAATNLRKHARVGEIQISRLSPHGHAGVEVLSIDRGPGMRDVQRCFTDGFTTSGTAGTGLGAIARLSTHFDIYSEPGKGTVLMSRIQPVAANGSALQLGVVSAPFKGEEACGDAWAILRQSGGVRLLLADGLGHGIYAADAAQAAVEAFRRSPLAEPAAAIDNIHRALRTTRGAAVAVAAIHNDGRIGYAGLGNIAGQILGGARPQSMLSHNGTAGHSAMRVQQFEYMLPSPGLVILHSDGLTSSWRMESYPGLSRRHPAVIAATLYRDASRGRDDVCVLVAGVA